MSRSVAGWYKQDSGVKIFVLLVQSIRHGQKTQESGSSENAVIIDQWKTFSVHLIEPFFLESSTVRLNQLGLRMSPGVEEIFPLIGAFPLELSRYLDERSLDFVDFDISALGCHPLTGAKPNWPLHHKRDNGNLPNRCWQQHI